jgi:ribonuclease HI
MTITTLDRYYNTNNDNLEPHTPTTSIQVYFDGLCQPYNPGGTACYAFIVKNVDHTIHTEHGLAADNSTNNVAEYTGLIRALQWLIANNYKNENFVIKGDSQLVIQQIKRNFKVRATNIIPLYRDAISLISKFNHIQFELIPREQNKEADKLANYAYTKVIADNPNLEKNQRHITPEQKKEIVMID